MRRPVVDERGLALPTTLLAALIVSSLAAAFLALAGMEPQIAVNLRDEVRARHLADAGIEWAVDRLAATADWSAPLGDPALTPPVPLPGRTAATGTFAVAVRNDGDAGDERLTGATPDAGGPARDTNGTLVITATGSVNGITRRLQAVVRRGGDPADTTTVRPAATTYWREL